MLTLLVILVVGCVNALPSDPCASPDWPKKIEYGRYSQTTYDKKALYHCHTGYKVAPEMTRSYGYGECTDGVMEIPECVWPYAHNCENIWAHYPNFITNGRKYRWSGRVQGWYKCDRGYKLTKESDQDGLGACIDKSLILPACEKDNCHEAWIPTTIENGHRSRYYRSQVWFKCNLGYKFSKESDQNGLVACKDDALIIPECEEACTGNVAEFPHTIDNGRRARIYKGTVWYKCDHGYKFTEGTELAHGVYAQGHCKESKFSIPACVKDNCNSKWHPHVIENGRAYWNSQGTYYRCYPGYKFTEGSALKEGATHVYASCKDDVLVIPECERDNCHSTWYPSRIVNGIFAGNNGQVAWYRCSHGYKFTNDTQNQRGSLAHTSCIDDTLIVPKCEKIADQ